MIGGGLGPGRDRKNTKDRGEKDKALEVFRRPGGRRHNDDLNEMFNVSRNSRFMTRQIFEAGELF